VTGCRRVRPSVAEALADVELKLATRCDGTYLDMTSKLRWSIHQGGVSVLMLPATTTDFHERRPARFLRQLPTVTASS